jgi:hypothetical protein
VKILRVADACEPQELHRQRSFEKKFLDEREKKENKLSAIDRWREVRFLESFPSIHQLEIQRALESQRARA